LNIKIFIASLLVVLVFNGLTGCTKNQADVSDVQLFNKVSLDGWYTFLQNRGKNIDPLKIFSVQDSMIRISGEEWGCITTEKEYSNYHLVVEFKWGEKTFGDRIDKTRDSGILLHSTGKDGGYSGIWMHSIECQMIEGGTGDILVVGDGSNSFSASSKCVRKSDNQNYFSIDGDITTINKGRFNWWGRSLAWKDTLGFRGSQDIENPVGRWNRLECFVKGDSLMVLLNGIVVNKAFNVKPQKGKIQIQSEGAELFIRRIDLAPLSNYFRFIYNNDANYMFIDKGPGMTPADLEEYVDQIASHGVTSFSISPNWGMVMNYPSEITETIGDNLPVSVEIKVNEQAAPGTTERAIFNFRSLIKAGYDPLEILFARAKLNDMETILSFRLNEVHLVEQKNHFILSSYWKNNPQWHIGNPGDPLPQVYQDILGPDTSPIVASWLPGGFDFSFPQVRVRRIAQLKECLERYDFDVLELDFQRFPMYFKPGTESSNITVMTNWISEIRKLMNQADKQHPVELGVRVMATLEQNTTIGLDPVFWAQNNLVDYIIQSHYLHNDFDLPVNSFKEKLPDQFPLYASIEPEKDDSTFLAISRKLWEQGVDGIQLFNFFTNQKDVKENLFPHLSKIGTPTNINSTFQLPAPIYTGRDLVFTDSLFVSFDCSVQNAQIYYSLDDQEPDINDFLYKKPVLIKESRTFNVKAVMPHIASHPSKYQFVKKDYSPAIQVSNPKTGLLYDYFTESMGNLNKIKSLTAKYHEKCQNIEIVHKDRETDFAYIFTGFLDIPKEGMYTFYLTSNDGSKFFLDNHLVIDHDGLHGATTKNNSIPLRKGLHNLELHYFQQGGFSLLNLEWKIPSSNIKEKIPASQLYH
jgi:hypothetical protein